nr:unnamed protein product [Callosobruchus analis]
MLLLLWFTPGHATVCFERSGSMQENSDCGTGSWRAGDREAGERSKRDGVGGASLVPETNLTGSYKLPEIYSTFSAEAFAINKALDIVCITKNKICILTDSLSTDKNKLQIEQCKGSSIVFIWTKAHSGITHNEAVDNLAKPAINNKDFSTHSLCLSDCINFLKKNTRDEWATSYQQYRTNTSTQYATIQEELPNQPWFYDLKISKRYAIGRYPACLAKIGILNTDKCETCNVPGTLDHIFFECSQYHPYQKQFLENLIIDGLHPPFNVTHLIAMNAQNVMFRIVHFGKANIHMSFTSCHGGPGVNDAKSTVALETVSLQWCTILR